MTWLNYDAVFRKNRSECIGKLALCEETCFLSEEHLNTLCDYYYANMPMQYTATSISRLREAVLTSIHDLCFGKK